MLLKSYAGRVPPVIRGQALAIALVLATTLVRALLGQVFPGILPLGAYFPAIVIAALLGGWMSGATALVLSMVAAWSLFMPPAALEPTIVNIVSFALVGGITVGVADRSRRLMAQLARRDVEYRTLIDTMSEGFALCEAIRDESGKLVDYTILDLNPALQRMLRVGPEAIGTKYSDSGQMSKVWLTACDSVLRTGVPVGREVRNAGTGHWHDVRLSRVSQDRIAQFFFDVTARKAAEEYQATLFDELNHRVKNNLAMVSSLLSLQARGADPGERERLQKAVDRIQSIAEVHASLYQGASRTDVDFGAYLSKLCQSLSVSLADSDRIRIEVDAVSALVPVDHVVPLGMAVNELVTNAAKYAFPAPATGAVTVRFSRDADGLQLQVGDDGVGLAADADAAGGLGMKLVRAFVQQVGGELTIVRAPGATFQIRLPNPVPARGREEALL